jgi:hypothetical protein
MWNWAGNKFRQRGEFEILYTKEKHIGKNHSSMCVALSEKFWELVWYLMAHVSSMEYIYCSS